MNSAKRTHALADPKILFLEEFVAQARQGEILTPNFQRNWDEWDMDRRLKLLDSIRRGIPIGSFLLWKTTQPTLRQTARNGPVPIPKAPAGHFMYLLDGLQRMTTVLCATTGPRDVAAEVWDARETPTSEPRLDDIVFDVEADCFVARNPAEARKGTLMPVHLVFDTLALYNFQKPFLAEETEIGREYAKRVEMLSSAFRAYKVATMTLITDDTDAAITAFVRINSGVQKMDDYDIVRAMSMMQAAEASLEAKVVEMQERLACIGWGGFDKKHLLSVIRAAHGLGVIDPSAERLVSVLFENSSTIEVAVDAIVETADYFRNELGIPSPAFLPYDYSFILVAAAKMRTRCDLEQLSLHIKPWYFRHAFTETFRGMSELEFQAQLSELTDFLKGKKPPWKKIMIIPIKEPYGFENPNRRLLLQLVLLRFMREHPGDWEQAFQFLASMESKALRPAWKASKELILAVSLEELQKGDPWDWKITQLEQLPLRNGLVQPELFPLTRTTFLADFSNCRKTLLKELRLENWKQLALGITETPITAVIPFTR